MSREPYNRIREERFGPVTDATDAALRAARQEIDRLDDEVARIKDSRQAMWDTLISRAAKHARLTVVIDRIDALHRPAYDDGDPDRPPWCEECGHSYPCRTAERIARG